MTSIFTPETLGLVGGVLILLGSATAMVQVLRRRADSGINTAILETFRLRVHAWWVLCSVLAAAFFIGQTATVVLFGLISFWALREFITLTPTRPGDHRTLFWVFFLITPLQFVLVGMEKYDLYSIVIPVYGFLFIPARIAAADDFKRFLERTAKIQAGVLICVYCLSYAPALLTLPKLPEVELFRSGERVGRVSFRKVPVNSPQSYSAVPGDVLRQDAVETIAEELRKGKVEGEAGDLRWHRSTDLGAGARLLFFFVLIVQLSDVLQYAWAQMIPSKHVVAPAINPTKTWEGLLGGTASVTLIGAILWWATPFAGSSWWMAAAMSMVIAVMGFAGGLTLSAIKRDRGVKDYGTLVEGHGGVLDRIDSICFAAPVFFHLTRYWLESAGATW